LGQSATRLGLARVEDGVSRAIRYATPRELGVPVSLHAVDNAHHEAIGPGICVSTGMAVLRNGCTIDLHTVVAGTRAILGKSAAARARESTAEHIQRHDEQHDQEASATAANHDRHADTTAAEAATTAKSGAAALIFDLIRV